MEGVPAPGESVRSLSGRRSRVCDGARTLFGLLRAVPKGTWPKGNATNAGERTADHLHLLSPVRYVERGHQQALPVRTPFAKTTGW